MYEDARTQSSRSEATFNPVNSHITAGRDINLHVAVNKVTESSVLTRLKAILNPVSSASYDSYEARQRSECYPNTRVQVLNDIETWITGGGHQASIYVLDGVAGIGKSTIAQTIAARAAKRELLGASFFFSRGEDLRKIPKCFFPTIAYQLARYDDQFATCIKDALDRNPDAPEKGLYQRLSLLLIEPLGTVLSQRVKETLIAVDALDECEKEGAEELLSLLGQYIHQTSNLKILITARPEWHLRRILDQDQNHERFRLHDVDRSVVHSDIRLYLETRLSVEEIQKAFPLRRTRWEPSAHDMKMLCGICGTLFIIAATATKFILNPQSNPQKQLFHLLNGVSPDRYAGSKHTNVLDETYLRIILTTQFDLDEIDEDWFRGLKKVLGALITLAKPLPYEALASLLEMDSDDIEAVLSNLHSLVAPSGSGADMTFRVHHQSFPDFITDRHRIQRVLRSFKGTSRPDIDTLLWIDVTFHHSQLAKSCSKIMNHSLRWNMADINEVDQCKDKKDIPRIVPELISQELAYAVQYWAPHLLSSGKINVDTELQGYLDVWVSRHMLSWIEAMIILDQVKGMCHILSDAIASIENSTATIAWTQKAKIEDALSDALRFVQQGSGLMEVSPIHIYRSCLPFIPTMTTLHHAYGSAAMLQVGMERSTQWDPLLMTCVGHSLYVSSVAFSGDGQCLASGSGDRTIRLWDAKTGAHIQTFTGHLGWVYSVDFSSSGLHLVSGSEDKTIRLWDVKTGGHILTFCGHSERIRSVAFSNDGSQLASGSDDETIRLWDANTGTNTFIMTGHSGWVKSVAFSKDGTRLASGSSDTTVRIWDAKIGMYLSTLVGHSDEVNSVVFSSDGLRLASGSDDKTVRLWNVKLATQILTLTGHSREVCSVVFSSDNLRVASGGIDETIRIWNANTGEHISTLSGHSDTVFSVAFSSDGSRLASASRDITVRLWDTSIRHGAEQLPKSFLSRHTSWVSSVAFSKDGSRLASGSYDNTICFWDAKTGIHISTLTGHSDWVRSVAFSCNGLGLASGSCDKTVRLWDVEAGSLIYTLAGHLSRVCSVVFSDDGLRLASGSDDRTIRLWDANTGEHLSTLTGHLGWVSSVIFLNDGLQLLSGSWDKTVRLWDTKTGSPILTLKRDSSRVHSIALSNDSSQVASVSKDKTIRLWDARTGALRSTLDSRAFSLSELISAAFLPCDGGVGTESPTSLLVLVKRETPFVTGLIKATLHSGDEWQVDPLCWFPPDMEVWSFAYNRLHFRVALGCRNGRIMVIDLSSEKFRLL